MRALAAIWVLFFLMALALAVFKQVWFAPLALLTAPFQLLFWDPAQRRQVFRPSRTTA